MRQQTRERLDQFFEENFEVSPGALSHQWVLVRPHPAIFGAYAGAYLQRNPRGYLLTVPSALVERTAGRVADVTPASLFDVAGFAAMFGDDVDVSIGPAVVAYADDTDFVAADARDARLLVNEDSTAMTRFRESCDPIEWSHGGAISVDPIQHPTYAAFIDGAIVAAASYDYQGEWIRHVGLIVHPTHRGLGLGTAVGSAITAYGLAEGGIMQWQTLQSNVASYRVGQALGYQPWVETIALRFRQGV